MNDDRAPGLANVLLQQWDVLSIADMDVEPQTEYLAEAQELLRLLDVGASEDELTACLTRRAQELSALPDPRRDRMTATAVLRWAAGSS